jgi:hypothetical protein
MFGSADSPEITSILSLTVGVAAAVVAGFYFGDAFRTGAGAALVVGLALAFAAVVLGMRSINAPAPGLVLALLGTGIGVLVIVLGFLAFLLNLTRS